MPGQSRSQQSQQASDSSTETSTQTQQGPGNAANQQAVQPGAEDQSTLEQLREAAKGTWWQLGNVDENLCLQLIGQLSPAQRAAAREDDALMRNLAGALNESEMVLAVNTLGFALAWKAYWIEIAGESADAAWSIVLAGTSAQERIDLVNWASFDNVKDDIGGTPMALFNDELGTATWDKVLSTSPAIARWMTEALTPSQVIEEIAKTGAIPAVVANFKAAGKWNAVVAGLPIGSAIQPQTKQAMRDIADEVGFEDTKKLFEKRFNASTEGRHEDEDGEETTADAEGATEVTWSKDDLLDVWDVLEFLPDQDVAENTVIRAYQAISGTGAFYSGPDANTERSGTIQLGQGLNETGDPHDLAHAVLHEVGHSVHARLIGSVNAWLQKSIGFWFVDDLETGIKELIAAMGGYPEKYRDFSNNEVDFGDAEKQQVVDLLVEHTGSTSWEPAKAVPDPITPVDGMVGPPSPDQQNALLWQVMPEKLKTVVDLSDDPWYDSYASLPKGPKGRYFINHWYSQVFYFSDACKTAIDATGDTYSAMSHSEFFANCYAEYFGDPAGFADHSKWGGGLNAPVKEFFKNNVLERQPYQASATAGGDQTKPGETTQGASETGV